MSARKEGGYGTPEFARVEIRLTTKLGLATAATELRNLADRLDRLAGNSLSEATSNFLAWGTIKSTSKRTRK